MTHAELYEIVKDHRDVWGKHFKWDYTRELFMEQWPQTISPIRNDIAESALLGLGVAWLVENGNSPTLHSYQRVHKYKAEWFPTRDCPDWHKKDTIGEELLAAVYAAIAEVKRDSQTEV